MAPAAITLLDATLRDGGYLNDWAFSDAEIRAVVLGVDAARVDVVEVGYLSDDPGQPTAARCPAALLSALRQALRHARIAVMLRPDEPGIDALLDDRREWLDLVRIPTQVPNPSPAIEAALRVEAFGIASSINLTSVSAFPDDELRRAVKAVARAGIACQLYLADSRGALTPEDVVHLVDLVQQDWRGGLGFHAHDNLGLALENSEAALGAGCTWIDGSLNGYGIGGQNADLRRLGELVAQLSPGARYDMGALRRAEGALTLPAPAQPRELYELSGRKNLKQEWVDPLVERFGSGAAGVLRSLPRRRYPTFEDALRECGLPDG